MARRGQQLAAPIPGDESDPASWCCVVDDYLVSLQLRALSAYTIYSRRRSLARFAHWNLTRCTDHPTAATTATIRDYQIELYHHRTNHGSPLTARTQQQYLIAIRSFYRWLHITNRITTDPTNIIELPKSPDELPRNYLTTHQAEAVLALPDLTTPLGRRNRTMLEILYATGIRRAELANLQLGDIDTHQHQLFVRHGKNARDRLIPTGQRAASWICDYVGNVRPLYASDPAERALFLTRNGANICTAHMGSIVAGYLRQAGHPTGNCHTFRHTTATLMLHHGADLRSIQTMLGHRNLASTQRYTHINIDHLTTIHTATHPSARVSAADPNGPLPRRVAQSLPADDLLGAEGER